MSKSTLRNRLGWCRSTWRTYRLARLPLRLCLRRAAQELVGG